MVGETVRATTRAMMALAGLCLGKNIDQSNLVRKDNKDHKHRGLNPNRASLKNIARTIALLSRTTTILFRAAGRT